MTEPYCKHASDHEPGEVCEYCGLEVDDFCNTESDFLNCCFPNCGCDGSRLCMAPSGANSNSMKCNVEGMYQRTDKAAVKVKLGVLGLLVDENKTKEPPS